MNTFEKLKVGDFVTDPLYRGIWGKVTKKLKTRVYISYRDTFADEVYDVSHAVHFLKIVRKASRRKLRK